MNVIREREKTTNKKKKKYLVLRKSKEHIKLSDTL